MTSFDFQGALASGATPQAITQYLTSQGAGNLASTYFNQQPAQSNSFQDALNSLKGFAANIASPITTAAATGVRAIQATPDVAGALLDAAQGKGQAANQDIAAGEQTMATPAFGQNTVEGNTPEQNIGEAVKGASLLVPAAMGENALGVIGTAAEGAGIGMAQNTGQAMTQNANLEQTAKAGVEGAGAGAAAGVALPIAAGAASKLGEAASDTGSALQDSFAKPPATPATSLDTAVNLTRGVQDEKYQLQAAAEDSRNIANGKPTRTSFNNGILDTTKIAPSAKEVAVAKSIQPLVDSGEVDEAKPYTQNAAAIDKQITSEVARVRAGADAVGAKLEATPEDIQKVFTETELPNKMGADDTQARLAAKFQQSIMDTASKSKDLLDFQQKFSKQAVKDFGQDVFTNPRNPAQEYLTDLRNNFNDLIQSKFPDGKLPEGDTFKAAQKNISNMIQAKEGVIENGVRGNAVGSNKITRALDKSPIGKALGRRIAMREATSGVIKGATAAGAIGLGALGYAAAKRK